MDRRRRHRTYFVLMGACVLLILLAWNVVRLWSTTAAVAMSALAALLPPIAAFVGNQGALDSSAAPTVDDDEPGRSA
ncbi:MAG: DUF3099 domain-containing protein [Nocardioides sp.]|nr:DUF3099 domain-containing protein [Nocardioides sp.]